MEDVALVEAEHGGHALYYAGVDGNGWSLGHLWVACDCLISIACDPAVFQDISDGEATAFLNFQES